MMSFLLRSYFSHYSNLTRDTWVILFSNLTNSFGNAATLFISLFLLKQLHFSVINVGFTITLIGVGAIIGAYLSGHLADYLSPRKIVMAALFTNGTALFLFGFQHAIASVYTLAFIIGFANAGFLPANRLMVMQSVPLHLLKRVTGVRYMMVNFGVGLGAFLAGMLSKFSTRSIFLFNAIAIFISALIILFFTKPRHKLPESALSTEAKKNTPLSNRNILFFLYLVLLLVSIVFSQFRSTFPIYLHHEYQLDEFKYSNLFLLNCFIIVVFQVPVSNILSRARDEIVIGIGCLLIGLGLYLLVFSTAYLNAVISTIVWTFGEILFFSILQAYIYQLTSDTHKGKAMGIYQSVYFAAAMPGPIIGTWIYTAWNPDGVWLFCLLLGVIGFLICLGISLKNKSSIEYN